jgi:hypothetical protein
MHARASHRHQEQSRAIKSNREQSRAIESNQEQSRAIKSNQEQSRAIKSNQEQSTASMKPSTWAWAQRTLNGTWTLVLERASSMEINGDQWRSMEINGDQGRSHLDLGIGARELKQRRLGQFLMGECTCGEEGGAPW